MTERKSSLRERVVRGTFAAVTKAAKVAEHARKWNASAGAVEPASEEPPVSRSA